MTPQFESSGGCTSYHLQGRGHIVAAALQAAQPVIIFFLSASFDAK